MLSLTHYLPRTFTPALRLSLLINLLLPPLIYTVKPITLPANTMPVDPCSASDYTKPGTLTCGSCDQPKS